MPHSLAPSGVHAVLYAYFTEAETLDRELMRRQVDIVLDAGVAGVNVLGLATEVMKLSERERLQLIDWTAEDLAGRAASSVTINGGSFAAQLEQVRAAERAGADWIILQPPTVGTYPAKEYVDLFARMIEATHLPVAIQNAPAYMGRGLSARECQRLNASGRGLVAIKGESAAVDIASLIAAVGSEVPVLAGRGGLEMLDSMRAGCAGFVVAPDLIDFAVDIWAAWRSENIAEAERLYGEALPIITFLMQSLEGLLVYGKRLFARRADFGPVYDRAPSLRPTSFGLELVEHYAQRLSGRELSGSRSKRRPE